MKVWAVAGAALAFTLVQACHKRVQSAPPPNVSPTVPAASPVERKTDEAPQSTPRTSRRRQRSAGNPASVTPPVSSRTTLEEFLTDEQKSQYLIEIEANLQNAQRTIAAWKGRPRSSAEAQSIGRVQAFVRQAITARKANDLATAKSLSERADLLSRELLRN